ncbi:hypothetical protein [Roseobacter sp. HKCCA0434]|uniref:hypothetical protein n=1 Tax=Roseobacter sp. HKCCA0434 TaxID=3079297 RepID=UPI002905E6D7|nr:hypothetical protein [Roseobacter sp. HKCCA0434]
MNLNGLINMVMRQVMRRGVNTAFKKSGELMNRSRQPRDPLADRERALAERERALEQMEREEALRRREEELEARERERRGE